MQECQLGQEPASLFCLTCNDFTLLCPHCVPFHEAQSAGNVHQYESVSFLGLVTALGKEEYLRRKRDLMSVMKEEYASAALPNGNLYRLRSRPSRCMYNPC